MTTSLPPLPYPATPAAPPAKRTGRPLGSTDKVSRPLKEAILLAAGNVGDAMALVAAEQGKEMTGGLTGYLEMVASSDVKSFCALLGKVLPMTIRGEGESGAIVVEIVRLAADRSHANSTT